MFNSILVLDLLGHRLVNGKRVPLAAVLEQIGGHRSWYMSRFCSKTDLGMLATWQNTSKYEMLCLTRALALHVWPSRSFYYDLALGSRLAHDHRTPRFVQAANM